MTGGSNIIDLPLHIDRAELLHFLEYPPGIEPPARIERIAQAVLSEADALLQARGSFIELPVARAAEIGLSEVDAERLVVGLVTAGPHIETRASELSRAGDLTRALVMDAAGSAAAEQVADLLGGRIAAGHEQPAAGVSCRLSPGYGHWSLQAQPALFAMLPHQALGVRLLPSLMMVPKKSISFAMWLGADGPIGTGIAGCSRCALERCRYRRTARATPTPAANATAAPPAEAARAPAHGAPRPEETSS